MPLPSPRVREESGKYLLLTGVEGDTGYTAQEHLKFLNGYNMGEGRTKKGLFPFLRSEILCVCVCVCVCVCLYEILNCETFKILDEVIAVKSVVSCYKNS